MDPANRSALMACFDAEPASDEAAWPTSKNDRQLQAERYVE